MVDRSNQEIEMFELILQLMRQLKRFTSRIGEAYSLSIPQVYLLWRLGDQTTVSMGMVADELHCDPSNVTGIVHRLEETGLVERNANAEDRRVKCLKLTDKGEKLREEMVREVVHSLPLTTGLDDDERSQLHQLLIKAIETSSKN